MWGLACHAVMDCHSCALTFALIPPVTVAGPLRHCDIAPLGAHDGAGRILRAYGGPVDLARGGIAGQGGLVPCGPRCRGHDPIDAGIEIDARAFSHDRPLRLEDLRRATSNSPPVSHAQRAQPSASAHAPHPSWHKYVIPQGLFRKRPDPPVLSLSDPCASSFRCSCMQKYDDEGERP